MACPTPPFAELHAACVVGERLAAEGRPLEALAAFNAAGDCADAIGAGSPWRVRVGVGRARALLALGRSACAQAQLDALDAEGLPAEPGFALHLCRAELLGSMGRVEEMDAAFGLALAAAAGGEARALARAWSRLLERAVAAEAWGYLLTEAAAARVFARRVDNGALLVKASLARARALLALGRRAQAERELDALLRRKRPEERAAICLVMDRASAP